MNARDLKYTFSIDCVMVTNWVRNTSKSKVVRPREDAYHDIKQVDLRQIPEA